MAADAARPSSVADAAEHEIPREPEVPREPESPHEPDAARTTPSVRGDAAVHDSGSGDRADAATRDAASAVFDTGDASASCRLSLDPALGEHACLHVLHGPFAALVAASEPPLRSLDRTHVVYSVLLPSAASGGGLALRVAQDSLYAIFASGDLPLRLRHESVELPVVHSQPVRVSCEGVSNVALWELDADREYELWLGPGAATVDLILEQVAPDLLSEVCSAESDASTDPVLTSAPDAGVLDAGLGSGLPDTGTSDAGICVDDAADAGSCPASCTPLGNACLNGEQCCSGRCFARQCVLAECRTEGYCERNEECCLYCHQTESPHCH